MKGKAKNALYIALILYIIAVLLCLIDTQFHNVIDKPHVSRCELTEQDLRILRETINNFFTDTKRYPSSEDGLDILSTPNKNNKTYLKKIPKDAWGHNYVYVLSKNQEDKIAFKLYSVGENGIDEFGENDDIDGLGEECSVGFFLDSKFACIIYPLIFVGIPVFFVLIAISYLSEITKNN